MKRLSNKPFVFTIAVLLTIFTILSDVAYAGRGSGGRGGGRGGGGARTSSVQRSGGSRSGSSRSSSSRSSRGGGASPRVSSGTSLQNRGNLSNSSSRQSTRQSSRSNAQSNRQANQGDRQANRSQNQANRQGNRQDNIGNRQNNITERQGTRQDNRTDRQGNRQEGMTNRQNNRQDSWNNNWYGGGWYGGGYYVPPGWGAWAGLAGLTTGLIIGATVNTAPPYYDTVYFGSSSYIYSDGVYMQPVDDSYVVVSPPVGAVVNYLPDGCTLIQDGDFQYYDCAGIYYEIVYQNGATVYRVMEF